ncbi:MAG: NAD(P)-dependent alcohol dehydrogenase [Chloroflexi bacterium]|nr:MAG: NAD(P)-dependent alcohol dehydrogenase [Chloroflexota bacterium]MBL1192757.1 NAD(P)-dependent alcohol dehydrogenase [Chloroflexota bacterium]NOH10051.1 NAD(P)-dependent alcohol dehydrogenase [Chloroflexota bacterium]
MKAMVYENYGPPEVLQLKKVEKPTPGENEVLIKIRATSATLYDCWVRSATAPPGFSLIMRLASGVKPKYPILGTDLAGDVEAVGENVTRLKSGDRVFGFTGEGMGAYAEYICLPQEEVALKPVNASYEEATAVIQGALTAWHFLRKANIQRGQKVLIFGASGGVGGYAVQLAKHHLGAEVTGVCSTSKLEYVRSLGADKVIDYTQEDFTRNGEVYDVIFDTVGKTPVSRTRRSIKKDGWYLLATFSLPMVIQLMWLWKVRKQNIEMGTLSEDNAEELTFLKELIEAGVIKSTIDKTYPLQEAAEAHRYVETGQKMGNVVITV